MYDVIIIGCGYAGSIMARKYAEDNKNVLIFEKRSHIAGNMYDRLDENGILVHMYGPHIAHMNDQSTYDFLDQFTEFIPYEHTVNAGIDGIEVPLPFNLTAIDRLFGMGKAAAFKNELITAYGMEKKIPILDLKKSPNPEIKKLAYFIFEKVFLHYTIKMWDLEPSEIDPSVTARVPVHISYDNRHFTSPIQVMPKHGYTKLFENILKHPNIELRLSTDGLKQIKLNAGKIYFNGVEFAGTVVFTGSIDGLFAYEYGRLPYRSLYFEHNTHRADRIQQSTVLNWPDKRPATRRTENKLLVCQPNVPGVTSTITEYPGKYDANDDKWHEPYYPIPIPDNDALYEKYKAKAGEYPNLLLIGRLAEYKYYNMEAIVQSALASYDMVSKGAQNP